MAYRVEIDSITESKWNCLLRQFDDASLYQTWAYGQMKAGVSKLSHLLLFCQDELVAMSQVRITNFPLLSSGIAYVHWGPLWKRRDGAQDLRHMPYVIRALRQEYVQRRGLMLRILPKVIDDDLKEKVRSVYQHEEFVFSADPDQTFLVDLTSPLEEIRSRFDKNIRRDLRNAEKQNFRIIEGTGQEALGTAVQLTKEMKERKKYFGSEPSHLLVLQQNLPEELKIRLIVAEHEGEPVATLGWQTIGKIGFPVIAATGNKGLKLRASFLLWWKMIEFYHENGYRILDVGGVNANRNPGGFLFKSRLTGRKDPVPDRYIGQFTACGGRLLPLLFRAGYAVRSSYRHMRALVAKIVRDRAHRTK